jgi:hypothetical protein
MSELEYLQAVADPDDGGIFPEVFESFFSKMFECLFWLIFFCYAVSSCAGGKAQSVGSMGSSCAGGQAHFC